MHHDLETGRLCDFIKGIFLGDVRDEDDLEAICLILVRIADLLRLVFRADGGDDSIALLQELFENVG